MIVLKTKRFSAVGFFSLLLLIVEATSCRLFAGEPQVETNGAASPVVQTAEKTSRDLFSYEAIFTGASDFKHSSFGSQDVLHNDFSYSHRFEISGPVFFRAGVEYERYDFGTSRAPVPNMLQRACATFALEYIVEDTAGAAIEVQPGAYYENDINANTIDIPWDAYVTIPLFKNVYGVIGAAGAQFYQYPVVPIGGITWLIAQGGKVRLEAVFPKASFVWNQSDDWEFRVLGEIYGGGFRADSDNGSAVSPRLRDAVLEYDEYRLGALVTWSRIKPFDIALGAGYSFQRTFNFHRANDTYELGGAPYCSLSVEADF